MAHTIAITPQQIPLHVDLEPGASITFKGSYHSKYDGADVDAASTTWPSDAPGGASIDTGGLVDIEGGGLQLTSRDPVKHEVIAVSTGKEGAACKAAHVASPCIVLRTTPQARSRLITSDEWTNSLVGGIKAEILVPPPVPAPAMVEEAKSFVSSPTGIGLGVGLLLAVAVTTAALASKAKRKDPMFPLLSTVGRIEAKLPTADPAMRAALAPTLAKARKTVKEGRVDARSAEGARLRLALEHVEQRLDESTRETRAAKEQEANDELLLEMESALDAAREVNRVA